MAAARSRLVPSPPLGPRQMEAALGVVARVEREPQ
jgi:hypothetical protein